jgi:O-antigen ligase
VSRFSNDANSLSLRLRIWRVSARIARDFAALGTGLNTFGVATIRYQTPGEPLHYQEAHNDYIQLLVEGGVVTAGIVALTIVAAAAALRKRLHGGMQRTETYWLRVGAIVGLVTIGLQSAVEFSLQMPGNAAMFTVLLALALHDPAGSRPRAEERIAA